MVRFPTLPYLVALVLLAASGVLNGQGVAMQAETGSGSAASTAELSVTQCQGINVCASWTFTKGAAGASGIGKWPTGEEAILTVTKLDQNEIVITRSDLQGTRSGGLRGTYTGKFQDGAVVGWYKSELKGKAEYGPWYWIVNTPSNTPLVFTVWHPDGSAPVLFTFSASSPGTRGIGTFAGGNEPVVLDRYDGTTILINRNETDPRWGGTGYYTGRVEGNEISGTVLYWDRGHRNSSTTTWRGVFGDARSGPAANSSATAGITFAQGLQGLHDAATVLQFFQPVIRFLNSNP